ncbi:hypothetical protein [Pseudomonas sp. LS-2]|nr:hypothetical protein [Pseudomonas sp. LS-2]
MVRKRFQNFVRGFANEFAVAAKAAPAIYFAPLAGAVKAVQQQAQKNR